MGRAIEAALGLALLSMLFILDGALAKDTIYNGESLNAEEYLENGPFKFIMQSDCNLVLYRNGDKAMWSSKTARKGVGCMAILQDTGNLVILANRGVIWASNAYTATKNPFRLVLQADGNVVVYGAPLWATNTS
ncbi:hypothetical protein Syun_018196 [Stephania yunnanensis]|uniref:Bulb-type lectin domain-containing protein n=1 Tax=Stephania yunnanensis TaxID=152371 RepID=A0AAP0NVY8_9MAGN